MLVDGHVHIGKSTRLQIDADGELLVRRRMRSASTRSAAPTSRRCSTTCTRGNRSALRRDAHASRTASSAMRVLHSTRSGRAALDELERCRRDYGMRGLKIYSTPEMSIAELAMIPILEKCASNWTSPSSRTRRRRNVYPARPRCRSAASSWRTRARSRLRRATGIGRFRAAERFEHLYLDTASSTIDMGFLEACVEALRRRSHHLRHRYAAARSLAAARQGAPDASRRKRSRKSWAATSCA